MDLGPLNATFNNILTIATGLALLVCTYFLVVAGFKFMTSGGNPSAIEASKSAAFNAAIGYALVIMARVLAGIIQRAVVV